MLFLPSDVMHPARVQVSTLPRINFYPFTGVEEESPSDGKSDDGFWDLKCSFIRLFSQSSCFWPHFQMYLKVPIAVSFRFCNNESKSFKILSLLAYIPLRSAEHSPHVHILLCFQYFDAFVFFHLLCVLKGFNWFFFLSFNCFLIRFSEGIEINACVWSYVIRTGEVLKAVKMVRERSSLKWVMTLNIF